ncbi:unnamed protein product [Phytophthora lilii]|uniref:Unnamed protein product n=1 Tax=Phytophthora lilii TaxID=2077276 RepID=A0A9W6TH32_9STRA|nr:unnamed protein product [Phytophthora lilii]
MKLLHAAPEARQDDEGAPFDVIIDSPYGSQSIDIEDSSTYSHFVFFAGGMGVTPLRAIARLHNECYFQKARVIHRLRFVWSVSDSESLQALMKIEDDRWISNPRAPYLPDVLLCPRTLNVSTETFLTEIYVTRGLVGSEIELDQQLGKCLLFHCRPDIEQILREMGREAVKQGKMRVAVVVSGPEAMSTEVIATCVMLPREMNLHFDVHTERFAF